MQLKFCPIAKAFFKQTPQGWERQSVAPAWALDTPLLLGRFVKTWQDSDCAMSVWTQFYWLNWSELHCLFLSVNIELEKRGIAPLQPIEPPQNMVNVTSELIELLLSKGHLSRSLPEENAELEEYDALAAMWNAQPKDYDPLDLQHISVGEAGSLRFRAKR